PAESALDHPRNASCETAGRRRAAPHRDRHFFASKGELACDSFHWASAPPWRWVVETGINPRSIPITGTEAPGQARGETTTAQVVARRRVWESQAAMTRA